MKEKRMKLVSIALTAMLLTGISSCDDTEDCCTIIDVDMQIHYQTQSGDDLINSNEDFDESNIKIYYKNGDNYEYVYKGNLDYPNMHHVKENGDEELVLTVFPSYYYEGEMSTTLIALNENVVDTLVCEFELGTNREVCKKAWLNGVEYNDRFIEVKK